MAKRDTVHKNKTSKSVSKNNKKNTKNNNCTKYRVLQTAKYNHITIQCRLHADRTFCFISIFLRRDATQSAVMPQ